MRMAAASKRMGKSIVPNFAARSTSTSLKCRKKRAPANGKGASVVAPTNAITQNVCLNSGGVVRIKGDLPKDADGEKGCTPPRLAVLPQQSWGRKLCMLLASTPSRPFEAHALREHLRVREEAVRLLPPHPPFGPAQLPSPTGGVKGHQEKPSLIEKSFGK